MKHLLNAALAIALTLTLTSCFQVIKWVFGHHDDGNKPQKRHYHGHHQRLDDGHGRRLHRNDAPA